MPNLVDEFDDLQRRAQANAVGQGALGNPDDYAKAERWADKLGLPVDTVARNIGAVKPRALEADAHDAMSIAPGLAGWMSDEENARIGIDQALPLAQLEQTAKPVFATPSASASMMDQIRSGGNLGDPTMRAPARVRPTFGSITRGLAQSASTGLRQAVIGGEMAVGDLMANAPPLKWTDVYGTTHTIDLGNQDAEKRQFAAEQFKADATRPDIRNKAGSLAYGGVESLLQTLPAIGISVALRSPTPALALGAAQSGTLEYGAVRGRGGSAGEAAVAGGATGAVEALTEKIPLGFIVDKFGKTEFKRFVSGMLLREVPSEQIATLAQDAIDTAIANPDVSWSDYWKARPEAAAQTLAATVIQAGAIGGVSALTSSREGMAVERDTQRAAAAPAIQDRIAKVVEAIRASPMPERSPDRFAALMNTVAQGQQVSVPADAVREYLQSLDPDQQAAFLDATEWGDQLAAAYGDGADLVMPAGDYLAKIAPTPAHEALADHVAWGDNMSAAEAKSFEDTYAELIGSQAETMGETLATAERESNPARRVFDDVQRQAREAGFTADASRHYAATWAARYEARAARAPDSYADAWEAYRASNVQIKGDLPGRLAEAQRVDRTDVVIDALRAGKSPQTTGQGPSLLNFISKQGGVVDLGGELSAMDLERWHVGRPGKRRLVRPASEVTEENLNASLERMAERAVDAGYLPEGAGEAELLAAMQAEQRGKPVFATPVEQRGADFKETVDQLDELLGRLGIDVGSAGNAEIKAALEAYRSDEGGNSYEQKARGNITFTDAGAVIRAFEGRDLSTLLHEGGHLWLEELRSDAASPGASDQVKADLAVVLDWFGVSSPDEIAVEQHEQFARGVEAYMLEGKAPSPALRDIFRSFSLWLKRIYRSLKALNVTLSPEIRGVFDRLVATDEEIDAARQGQALNRLFTDAKSGGMTQAEYDRYTANDMAAETVASERLLKKLMDPLRRQRTAEWRDERETLREDAEAEVDAQPDIAAMQRIKESGGKLSREALVSMYGSDAVLDRLPRRVPPLYDDKGEILPDAIAQAVGANSGEALINALMTQEQERRTMRAEGDKRSVRDARVDALMDREMFDRYGDALNDGSIEAEAMDALHERRRADRLAKEGAQLSKLAGSQVAPWSRAAFEAFAKEKIGNLRATKVSAAAFLKAERSAGIAAQRALAKGDYQAALEAKFTQTLNFHLYRAALDAEAQVSKAFRLFDKVLGGKDAEVAKTRNMDILNAARAVLSSYGYERPRNAPQAYLDSLKAYDEVTSAILQPYVDAAIIAAAEINNRSNTASAIDMATTDEFTDLDGVIRQLWAMSRSEKVAEIDGRKIAIDAIADELIGEMTSKGPPPGPPGATRGVTTAEKRKAGYMGTLASLKKVEEWATRQGPAFTRYVWRPVKQAADAYRADHNAILVKLHAALQTMEADFKKPFKIEAPELFNAGNPVMGADGLPKGYTFGAEKNAGLAELIGALRHIGNESNKRKLLLGRGWGSELEDGSVDTSRWDAFLARMIAEGKLDKRHFDYVQAEWDLHEEIKPKAQKAHREMYGRYFDEVTANPFDTPWGRYAGGYVAAKVDPHMDARADSYADADLLKGGRSGAFMFPGPANGFTKSRTEYNRPLDLNLRLAISQMDEVLKFTHLGPAVRGVNRILTHKAFKETLNAYDPTAWGDMLLPWLERTLSQRINTPSRGRAGQFLDRTTSIIARNTGMTIMFGSLINTAQQVTGLSIASLRTGKRNMAMALADYIANPKGVTQTVLEASPLMQDRNRSQMVAIADTANEIVLAPNLYEKAVSWTSRHAYFLQHAFQNVLDPIVWMAARSRALELGEENPEAYADGVVSSTQGSRNAEDVTRFTTGPAWAGAFKMFSGYFLDQANLLATEWTKSNSVGRKTEIIVMGFMVPAVLSQLIADMLRGGWDDDEGDGYWDEFMDVFMMSQVRYALAMVPYAGAAVNAAINRFDDKPYNDRLSISPAISVAETAGGVPFDIWKLISGDGDPGRAVKDVATAVSLITGLVPVQRQLGYVADVQSGKVRPTNPIDAGRGFVTGTASPASRQ